MLYYKCALLPQPLLARMTAAVTLLVCVERVLYGSGVPRGPGVAQDTAPESSLQGTPNWTGRERVQGAENEMRTRYR